MARRSDHSRQDLCQMIVDAATDIIKKNGISSLSARKIAAEIGYTVGTLYNLYKNVDEIVMYVNGNTLALLHSELEASINLDEQDPKKKMLALAKAYMRYCNSNYHLWNTLFEYRLKNLPEVPRWYNEKICTLRNLVKEVISSIVSSSDSRKVDMIASILWANLHGLFALSSRGKLSKAHMPSMDDRVLELSIETLLHGFCTNELVPKQEA